jgi:glutamate:GABA antiporter
VDGATPLVLQPETKTQSAPTLKRELGLRDLTLFAVTCIVSARWIPIAAQAGPTSVTIWLLSAVFFMVPLTVAIAALVAKYPREGGIYLWTKSDFGPWHGFLSFWVYWMGIAFMFPTAALLYVRAGFSLLGNRYAHLGDNRFYLLTATLVLIWIAMGTNLIGLKIGKWTENIGALATWGVGLSLVVVACFVWTRRGSATPIHIVPTWKWGTIGRCGAIAYAMSGMEGPGIMAGETRDPERTMRRAGWLATVFTVAFYVSATVAMLVVLPPEKITELNGFAEMGESAGQLLGVTWLLPLIALLVLVSGVGFVGGVGTATSRLPFVAGVDGLLPRAFSRIHPRWGTPYVSTLTLGLVATFLLIVYQLGDSARAAYDELVSLMVLTGFIPYLYVFASAWKAGKRLSAASGLAITALAVLSSVVPPTEVTNTWLFEGKLAAGTLAVVASGAVIYSRRKIFRGAPSIDFSPGPD